MKVAFTPEAKKKALEMIDNLRAAMGERIQKAEWMSDETKKQALVKLGAFNQKIGYPDEWRDYSALEVVAGPYATNYLSSRRFAVQRDLGKIGKPVRPRILARMPRLASAPPASKVSSRK